MSGGGWSCPHEVGGNCSKVNDQPCDPGMKGCELYGRYAFFNDDKNDRLRQKAERLRAPAAEE
ncbi:MAG: hypothetical protein HY777_13795 [Betaproteobacteria bacterium]|nr:hypothetical protein [Betaproteobacteria bacterium]